MRDHEFVTSFSPLKNGVPEIAADRPRADRRCRVGGGGGGQSDRYRCTCRDPGLQSGDDVSAAGRGRPKICRCRAEAAVTDGGRDVIRRRNTSLARGQGCDRVEC